MFSGEICQNRLAKKIVKAEVISAETLSQSRSKVSQDLGFLWSKCDLRVSNQSKNSRDITQSFKGAFIVYLEGGL